MINLINHVKNFQDRHTGKPACPVAGNRVKHLLKKRGILSELVPIKSEGDLDLVTPLYAMGVQGIFTRSLDQALLNNQIDLAVHSMKDVPVQLPKGIAEAAVLERDSPFDILVLRRSKPLILFPINMPATLIASSSLRRKSQWLHRFPEDQIEPIRGNVNTRLKKLGRANGGEPYLPRPDWNGSGCDHQMPSNWTG